MHYDWIEAGEQAQRTVAALSQQLRRFLDDQAWLENRRIMDILHGIESKALALREAPPAGNIMTMAEARADIELTLERPLFTPTIKPVITDLVLQAGDEDIDPSKLFDQVIVDKARLSRHIQHALQDCAQITLSQLVIDQPLQHGLAELVAYLQLGCATFNTVVDEDTLEPIHWSTEMSDGQSIRRSAGIARIIFTR